MSDNKLVPQKNDSAAVALQKTSNLLSITNKILANRANRTLVVSDDAWLEELIAWANENGISEEQLPRDKQAILVLTELDLGENQLTEIPDFIGKLTNLTEANSTHKCNTQQIIGIKPRHFTKHLPRCFVV